MPPVLALEVKAAGGVGNHLAPTQLPDSTNGHIQHIGDGLREDLKAMPPLLQGEQRIGDPVESGELGDLPVEAGAYGDQLLLQADVIRAVEIPRPPGLG